ncbi:hypothetical protein, partial [Ralstonia solanacearum]
MRLAVDIVLDLLIEFALVFLDIGKAEATGDLDPFKGCVLIAKGNADLSVSAVIADAAEAVVAGSSRNGAIVMKRQMSFAEA